MVCPNHDDTQICPDCTYHPRSEGERWRRGLADGMSIRSLVESSPSFQAQSGRNYITQASSVLPPLEQHKADLEMIIAACVTGAGMTGEAACMAIAKLANGMLLRIDGQRNEPSSMDDMSSMEIACEPYVADVTRRVLRLRCTCGWRGTAHTPAEAEAVMTEHKS